MQDSIKTEKEVLKRLTKEIGIDNLLQMFVAEYKMAALRTLVFLRTLMFKPDNNKLFSGSKLNRFENSNMLDDIDMFFRFTGMKKYQKVYSDERFWQYFKRIYSKLVLFIEQNKTLTLGNKIRFLQVLKDLNDLIDLYFSVDENKLISKNHVSIPLLENTLNDLIDEFKLQYYKYEDDLAKNNDEFLNGGEIKDEKSIEQEFRDLFVERYKEQSENISEFFKSKGKINEIGEWIGDGVHPKANLMGFMDALIERGVIHSESLTKTGSIISNKFRLKISPKSRTDKSVYKREYAKKEYNLLLTEFFEMYKLK